MKGLEFTFSTAGNAGVLSLNGRLVKDHVVITFRNVREVDVHCFDLLCAAGRIPGSWRKSLTLTGVNNDGLQQALKELVSVCGPDHKMPCFKNCLWK